MDTAVNTSCKNAALVYASNYGWYVFPAKRGLKESHKCAALSGGRKWGRTKDPVEIEADFRYWTAANLGVVTGEVSGIFVVEGDTLAGGHTQDGLASLSRLQEQHGRFPVTLMAESPSGSLHYYFLYPTDGSEVRNSASKVAPGVDVRGTGGMVIAPPSVRYDGVYRWVNEGTPIAEAPPWLLQMVKTPPRPAHVRVGVEADIDIALLEAALKVYPNEGQRGWEEWNNTGMALWRSTGGSESGLALFDEWSSRSPKYSAVATAVQWDENYTSCPPERINGASVLYWANEAKPGWRAEYETALARRRDEQVRHNIEIGAELPPDPPPTLMTLGEMIADLYWVGGPGAVVNPKTGQIRRKAQAMDEYSASQELIKVKVRGVEEEKLVPALKLWLASKKRKSVDVLGWDPGAKVVFPAPEGFDAAGPKALNTWRGLSPMVVPTDWVERSVPFKEHLDYLIPVPSERLRFVQWLAHIIKRPEVLPHTCYLMVATTTGIGRNWLASVLSRVLRGHVAVGVSLPNVLESDFNGRLSRKLLSVVDELREGAGGQRYQRAQRLKSIITEDHRLINHKYGVQVVEKNACRWLMFSNHYDALPFDNGDRRIEFIANPTQVKAPEYYRTLYRLLNDPWFIAACRQLLGSIDISDFNPGAHATMNAAKRQALAEMKTDVEQKVEDFKAGWEHPLVSRKEIDARINAFSPQPANAMHVTHAINAAGMVNTGKRIRHNDVNHKVVIVDTASWTIERVEGAHNVVLLTAMGILRPSGDDTPF